MGNDTSKSALTCSDGTKRCGEGLDLSAALAAVFGLAAASSSLSLESSSLFGAADSAAGFSAGAAAAGVAGGVGAGSAADEITGVPTAPQVVSKIISCSGFICCLLPLRAYSAYRA